MAIILWSEEVISLTTRPFAHVSDWELEVLPRLGRLPHRSRLRRAGVPPELIVLNLSGEPSGIVRERLGQLEEVTPFNYLSSRFLRFSRILHHQGEVFEAAFSFGDRYPIPLKLFLSKAIDTMIVNRSIIDLNVIPLVVLPAETKLSLSTETINHALASHRVRAVVHTALLGGMAAAAVRFSWSEIKYSTSHEAGHILGLWRHCRNSQCLMRKGFFAGGDFCPRCLEKLERTYRWLQL